MSNSKLSVQEARRLSKYYGNLVRKEDEYDWSENDKIKNREILNFLRSVILNRSRKKVNQ